MIKVGPENQRIAVASHMELCETLSQRKDFDSEVSLFLEKQLCLILIVMGLEINETVHGNEKIRRDILITPANEVLGLKLLKGLKQNPTLALSEKKTTIDNAALYEQGDVSYSRKKIVPLIHEIAA